MLHVNVPTEQRISSRRRPDISFSFPVVILSTIFSTFNVCGGGDAGVPRPATRYGACRGRLEHTRCCWPRQGEAG